MSIEIEALPVEKHKNRLEKQRAVLVKMRDELSVMTDGVDFQDKWESLDNAIIVIDLAITRLKHASPVEAADIKALTAERDVLKMVREDVEHSALRHLGTALWVHGEMSATAPPDGPLLLQQFKDKHEALTTSIFRLSMAIDRIIHGSMSGWE